MLCEEFNVEKLDSRLHNFYLVIRPLDIYLHVFQDYSTKIYFIKKDLFFI